MDVIKDLSYKLKFAIIPLVVLLGAVLVSGLIYDHYRNFQSYGAIMDAVGRERLYIQQHTLPLRDDGSQPDASTVHQRFQDSLTALLEGGTIVTNYNNGTRTTVPKAPSPDIRRNLRTLRTKVGNLRNLLQQSKPPHPEEKIRRLKAESLQLADRIVKQYTNHFQSRFFHSSVFLLGVVLVGGLIGVMIGLLGYWDVHTSIEAINRGVRDIKEDGVPSIEGVGRDEFGVVAATIETISRELQEQRELTRTIYESMSGTLAVIEGTGSVRLVNQALADLTGYATDSLQGMPVDELLLDDSEEPLDVETLGHHVSDETTQNIDAFYRTESGDPVPVLLSVSKTDEIDLDQDSSSSCFILTGPEYSERKQYQQELVDSNERKKLLLSEIHHRIKNNLSIISAMLNLQKRELDDENLIEVLDDSTSRIQSVAALHEKLYKHDGFTTVNAKQYFADLLEELKRMYSSGKQIDLQMDIDSVDLTVDQAVASGVILNETVNNALKHAFDGKEEGTITTSFTRNNGDCVLTIEDDGRGFGADVDPENSSSIGMKMIHRLVNQQLNGSFTPETNGGARYRIEFPYDST